MKDEIFSYLNDARQLEKLYRTNKVGFKRDFITLYPEIKGNTLADYWNERLNYESDEINWGTGKELLFVIFASFLAGFIAKVPAIFSISEDFFYPRNIGFIIFPVLTAFFVWKNKFSPGKIAIMAGAILVGLLYINALPDDPTSDTLILSCLHLPFLLWLILGISFVGKTGIEADKRLDYLKFNGDLLVITAPLLIAGAIMSGLTIGLFSLIGYNIEEFYGEYVVVFLLPAAPILGTYLTQTNPTLVDKVSPVIAKIFSPLVLVMLVIYLLAMVYSGKDPYNDREFLLMFNGLLVGVLAIIFFSVAEGSKTVKSRAEIWVLFLLSIVTIIVNGIALSAILFRISEWGITPNRAAVLGGNVLILINLLLVALKIFRVISKNSEKSAVGKVIAYYLPIYFMWAIMVTFLFPYIFGFK